MSCESWIVCSLHFINFDNMNIYPNISPNRCWLNKRWVVHWHFLGQHTTMRGSKHTKEKVGNSIKITNMHAIVIHMKNNVSLLHCTVKVSFFALRAIAYGVLY